MLSRFHASTLKLCALAIATMGLNACAEVELASHVVKQTPIANSSKSKGKFKVGSPYRIKGQWYKPKETYNFEQTGIASWYGPNFHGKKTANGEIFDMYELTAAHKTLQIPSLVRVTNLENGRSIVVRVNDRGPFSKGRIIDLSKRSAELLDFKNKGVAKVKIQVLSEESRKIAQAAKRGESTRGVEMAYNTAHSGVGQQAQQQQIAELDALSTQSQIETTVPGHLKQGKFYPDPVVEQRPVGSSNIYVQAGAFRNQQNAQKLAASLQQFGNAQVHSKLVNGTEMYRVRIGPVGNVPEADRVLSRLANAGQADAIVIID